MFSYNTTDIFVAILLQLLLIITCSASCEVHGEYLIKLAEVRLIQQIIKSNVILSPIFCLCASYI